MKLWNGAKREMLLIDGVSTQDIVSILPNTGQTWQELWLPTCLPCGTGRFTNRATQPECMLTISCR